jgi:hypothetical protein
LVETPGNYKEHFLYIFLGFIKMSTKSNSRVHPIYVEFGDKPDVEAFIASMKLDAYNKTMAMKLRQYNKRIVELPE